MLCDCITLRYGLSTSDLQSEVSATTVGLTETWGSDVGLTGSRVQRVAANYTLLQAPWQPSYNAANDQTGGTGSSTAAGSGSLTVIAACVGVGAMVIALAAIVAVRRRRASVMSEGSTQYKGRMVAVLPGGGRNSEGNGTAGAQHQSGASFLSPV